MVLEAIFGRVGNGVINYTVCMVIRWKDECDNDIIMAAFITLWRKISYCIERWKNATKGCFVPGVVSQTFSNQTQSNSNHFIDFDWVWRSNRIKLTQTFCQSNTIECLKIVQSNSNRSIDLD